MSYLARHLDLTRHNYQLIFGENKLPPHAVTHLSNLASLIIAAGIK